MMNNTGLNQETQTATLGGGCFWCTEAIFKRLKGVVSVTPGYGGGNIPNPSYEQVCSGTTGHAECIQIEFNPQIIDYEKILEVFMFTHDPTTLNQQGNDIGTQYRSVIFYHDGFQKTVAEDIKKTIEKENIYKKPIVTQILPFTNFYPAEDYHKNYFDRNKDIPYCSIIINPKIQKLLKKYKKEIKEEYIN